MDEHDSSLSFLSSLTCVDDGMQLHTISGSDGHIREVVGSVAIAAGLDLAKERCQSSISLGLYGGDVFQ